MKILDAMLSTVNAEILIVMGVSFVAVVWWAFRKRGGGVDGGDAPGGSLFDGNDDDGGDGDGGD